MNHPRAYTAFREQRGYQYRTSTYIQWGDASESRSLGSCLLLNPGSAALFQTRPAAGHAIMGQIKPDPTMEQLIRFTEAVYPERPLKGRLYVYHLFSLQNPSSNDAIESFEQLVEKQETTLEQQIAPLEELRQHPWLLLSWGCLQRKTGRHFSALKSLWQKQIALSGVPAFGKRCANGQDYHHPCPQLFSMRAAILHDLVTIYRETLGKRPSSPASTLDSGRT